MDSVKVNFSLVQDDDGWPPVTSEGLWALPLGDRRFRVGSVPWFVPGLAIDDTVRAVDQHGMWWATEVLDFGGRMTIRVIPYENGPLHGSVHAVLDAFTPLRVTGEGAVNSLD